MLGAQLKILGAPVLKEKQNLRHFYVIFSFWTPPLLCSLFINVKFSADFASYNSKSDSHSGQPRVYQSNQMHGFRCPAFETGTTWFFFFNFEHYMMKH